jgi:hypothetical protein
LEVDGRSGDKKQTSDNQKKEEEGKKRKERNLFGYYSGRWLTGDIGDT